MHEAIDHDRRRFFGAAALTFTAAEFDHPRLMAGLSQPSSPANASTIGCRMRVTPYRSRCRKRSPTQSWK
jgi:hypothetical protein